MSIALAITTDGRGEYLERTIASIDEHLSGDITHRVLWDDSGDPEYLLGLDVWIDRGWNVWRSAPHRTGHAQYHR